MRRFQSLARPAQIRMVAGLCDKLEALLWNSKQIPSDSGQALLQLIEALDEPELAASVDACKKELQSPLAWNALRHKLASLAGRDKLEWDLHPPLSQTGSIRANPKARLEVYLHSLRSPYNVGSIIRTADAVAASRVLLHPDCPPVDNSRLARSAMGALDWVPTTQLAPEELQAYAEAQQLSLVALETGGTELSQFEFPSNMLLVLGSEETGLPPEFLRGMQVLSIAMYGNKASLNVGVSFGIAAFAWRQAWEA